MAVENAPGAAPRPPGQPRPAVQPQPQPKPAAQPAAASQSDEGSGEGLRDAVQALYRARTEVPGRPGVDGRLDNRQGRFAPPLEKWPAKPQQIDGQDLSGQVEHTRRTLQELEDAGERKGMYSPGPHGLSDEQLRETDEPLFGTESVPAGDLSSGSEG
jgi:hypothetical protein